jgi:hypothetical protein
LKKNKSNYTEIEFIRWTNNKISKIKIAETDIETVEKRQLELIEKIESNIS